MTPAIALLLFVVVLRALGLGTVGLIVGWPLGVFLVGSVLVDLFKNVPSVLLSWGTSVSGAASPAPWAEDVVADFGSRVRRNYVFFMGASLVIRIATVVLLGRWFLFS